MDLLGLDAGFRPVKALFCVNIQWNRRYYEPGDYQLQLRTADWSPAIVYIYAPQRPETGMVEKVETQHTVKGDFVLVSGFFLEGMLNWKVVYPRYRATGNLSAACRALVTQHMADTGVTAPAAAQLGTEAVFDAEGETLGGLTYAMLKLQEMGQRIRLDYEAETLLYGVWQGLDRCQTQSAHAYAMFSRGAGTVDMFTYTKDTSAYRNYAVAAYDGGVEIVDRRAGGEPVRALYLNTGLSIEEGQTQEDFLASVRTAALAELANYESIVNVDANALQNNLRYLTNYDLGDKCDVRDDRLQLAFEARIIEVDEVWKKNTHTVSLQFGDKIPTVYQRGRA